MPRVVPSVVVDAIDHLFPYAKDFQPGAGEPVVHRNNEAAKFQAVSDLVESIAPELLVRPDPSKYAGFSIARSYVRSHIAIWTSIAPVVRFELHAPEALGGMDVIAAIRGFLVDCPDEAPSESTDALSFITDAETRETLRLDLAAVERAFANGEWKAATVLAGATIEALLLWGLDQKSEPDLQAAETAALNSQLLRHKGKQPIKTSLDDRSRTLAWYIAMAHAATIIKDRTRDQAVLAQDFRNLIHPGKTRREDRQCNRGTAAGAFSALDLVIGDLS